MLHGGGQHVGHGAGDLAASALPTGQAGLSGPELAVLLDEAGLAGAPLIAPGQAERDRDRDRDRDRGGERDHSGPLVGKVVGGCWAVRESVMA